MHRLRLYDFFKDLISFIGLPPGTEYFIGRNVCEAEESKSNIDD